MNRCFFITGTDTDVGKTVVSCIMLKKASNVGYTTVGYKPVSTGISEKSSLNFINSDISLLRKYSDLKLSDSEISPIVFSQKTSPNIASRINGREINLEVINFGLENLKRKADFIVVEGVGGWYTPLSFDMKISDWVKSREIPIILTVSFKIGCINHALLTVEAVQNSNLKIVGWVANRFSLEKKFHSNYFYSLLHMIPYPCIGIIPDISDWQSYPMEKYIKSRYIF
ncbi:dethiobiotin synthase [Candidatus Riesia pediculischaeffi]|uniref:ATP-dependent dethiobiotin synthetase BioD n=1 Tax=Candidatus Riesia pediculischaeffi PTSU TaxID=1401651 RepID=A0A0C1VK77_9ENTR|nr:dethiobiotin synthase [Candidatus Riesia pediculischaeffi]KIE64260.1 Dethiobiotin synthetase [Candidatus Riesia pediculischaeffi PTSU]